MAKQLLNTTYGVRVNDKAVEKFKKHCEKKLKRDHTDITREMMTALVEGRLTITPAEGQTLYN